jgi:hypothetical protein
MADHGSAADGLLKPPRSLAAEADRWQRGQRSASLSVRHVAERYGPRLVSVLFVAKPGAERAVVTARISAAMQRLARRLPVIANVAAGCRAIFTRRQPPGQQLLRLHGERCGLRRQRGRSSNHESAPPGEGRIADRETPQLPDLVWHSGSHRAGGRRGHGRGGQRLAPPCSWAGFSAGLCIAARSPSSLARSGAVLQMPFAAANHSGPAVRHAGITPRPGAVAGHTTN